MDTLDLDGRYTIDELGRVYTDHEDTWLPSVSTVLDVRETPTALENWKRRTDDHEAVMKYTQNRGTVAHARCLSDLVPRDMAGDPVVDLWGDDEADSKAELRAEGDWERCQDDLAYIDQAWETIKAVQNFDDVIDVETFVTNTEIGYAGQFDLLYQDHETDETVLADLKTSKYVYDKHLIQLCAYKMAVPMAIDRMEVIRMNPGQRDWRVYSSHDWEEDTDELVSEFIDLREQLSAAKLETIIEMIQEEDIDDVDGIFYEPMETRALELSVE